MHRMVNRMVNRMTARPPVHHPVHHPVHPVKMPLPLPLPFLPPSPGECPRTDPLPTTSHWQLATQLLTTDNSPFHRTTHIAPPPNAVAVPSTLTTPQTDISPDAFRAAGHRLIDWVAEYLEHPERYPVL